MPALIQSFDNAILLFIQNNLHAPWLDPILYSLTIAGEYGAIWILIAICLLFSKNYRKAGLVTLLALIFCGITAEIILKNLVQRPRPFIDFPSIKLLIDPPGSFSFPSGHTTAAFAAAGVLTHYLPRPARAFWLLAGLIAFSRLYFFVHYPTDILGGIIVGLLCSLLAVLIFEKPHGHSNQLINY